MIRVEPSGTVTAYTGASAHGQGHETTFAQLIADYLGVDFDQVVVRHGDTTGAPMGFGTGGSRSLVVGGSAMVKAAEKVQERARRVAASALEAAFEDVVVTDALYHVKGSPARSLTLARIAERAYGEALAPGLEPGLEATDYFRPPQLVYPFGAHVAVVEVDRDTGRVEVRAFFSVDDCGVRISPLLVEGQVHGGIAQGVAQALLEEVVYDAEGQLVTGSLMDYALPHAAGLPALEVHLEGTPTSANPLGVKGTGQAGAIAAPQAVMNAIVDALAPLGIDHVDMPATPERLWQAIRAAG
jgi:carbon-monoxide dehydrogenase large subunit